MSASQAQNGGRPSKYDPAYCEAVVDFMAEGYSLAAFAGCIRVATSTAYKWEKEQPEFAEAVAVGRAARQFFGERLLLTGDPKKATQAIFMLKNAAPDDFRDKREVEHGGAVTIERIERVIVNPPD